MDRTWEWDVTAVCSFRGVEYEVSASVSEETLTVQVEEIRSADQWRAEFEAKHIEELTKKTGNFKQFPVFFNMLKSAVTKSSSSVNLDLLTYNDLEALRSKKMGGATSNSAPQLQDKRYLILTYSAEFDRIHYPLALPYVGKPDPVILQETIRKLQYELTTQLKQGNHGQKQLGTVQLQQDYDTLLQEKKELEEELEQLQQQLKLINRGHTCKDVQVLKKIIKNLEEDILKERSKHQKQINKANMEIRSLLDEVEELRSTERTLQARVRSLTSELAELRQSWRASSGSKRGSKGRDAVAIRANTRQRSSSRERPLQASVARSRSPSPAGTRFDPTAYVQSKQAKQMELKTKKDSTGSKVRSRSNSLERATHPPLRSTPVTSASIPSKKHYPRASPLEGSGSSRASSRRSSVDNNASRNRSSSKRSSQGSGGKRMKKTSGCKAWESPTAVSARQSAFKSSKHDSSLLDHSADMSNIDARLKALQQFMKHSLDAARTCTTNR